MMQPLCARRRMLSSSLLLPILVALAVLPAATAVPAAAQEEGGLAVDSWLALGPVAFPLPAFHDAERHGAEAADLLSVDGADPLRDAGDPWPVAGERVALPAGGTAAWERVTASDGAVDLGRAEDDSPRLAWLATRIDADRFVKAKLSVRSPHPLRVYLDGEQVAEKGADAAPEDDGGEAGQEAGEEEEGAGDQEDEGDGGGDDDSEPGEATAEVTLPPGPHLLVVRTVRDPESAAAWRVAAELAPASEEDGEPGDGEPGDGEPGDGEEDGGEGEEPAPLAEVLTVTTDAPRPLTLGDLLDVPSIEGVEVSADGELAAITLANPAVPAEDRETWVEIRRADDGSLVQSFRGGASRSSFAWAPEGRRYLFTTGDGEKTTLWIGDLDAGTAVPLLEGIEHFGGATWSPEGSFLVYTVFAVEEPGETHGFKRLRALQDRWPQWRRRGSLYQVAVPEEIEVAGAGPAAPMVRRLTAGDDTTSLVDVAPDGSKLLFSRPVLLDERPYTADDLFELDLETLEARNVEQVFWMAGARYSPDGGELLVAAGPSAFGDVGLAVPEGMTPNDYDTQLYLYDLGSGDVRPLTESYDPSVGGAEWAPDGRAVYLRVTDGPFERIVRRTLGEDGEGAFEELPTGVDSVAGMDLSRDGSRLVFSGSSAAEPHRVASIAISSGGTAVGAPSVLLLPGAERFEEVELGRVEDFSFETAEGDEIVGRVHLPPGFDPATAEDASLPAIVYYYGGVVPVGRTFGGRYPFNWWAAHGYAVYVLQPSGAVGFGQELAARHVNDWGKVVAGEIIEGAEAFLAAHPFVDPERVGAGGASYGGFTTMYLLTETDMFDAAVAHAGISSLASYWGEGWWGYLYSAVASAESFPWNRRDLYVEQSPLFRADRITTPLLLLHGAADTNVPVGESEQLFAALTLLGREVEMIEIEGADHHVLQYPKRRLWMETIVAWFDRELKDRPGWWEHLYPAEGGP